MDRQGDNLSDFPAKVKGQRMARLSKTLDENSLHLSAAMN